MHVSSTLRQLWRTARKTPVTVALALISTLMVTLCDIIIPLITATAIDSATAADGGHSAGGVSITTVVVLLVVAALVRYLFQFGRRYTAGRLSNTVQHQLRVEILRSLQRLDGPGQDQLRTGQVVSRSISDLNLTQAMVAMMPLIVGHVLKIVITLGVMLWISPLLTLIAVVLLPLLAWLTMMSRPTLFAATWAAQQAVADLSIHVEETVSGIRVVKAFVQESREVATLRNAARVVYAQMMRAARLTARYRPLVQQIPNISPGAQHWGGWLSGVARRHEHWRVCGHERVHGVAYRGGVHGGGHAGAATARHVVRRTGVRSHKYPAWHYHPTESRASTGWAARH